MEDCGPRRLQLLWTHRLHLNTSMKQGSRRAALEGEVTTVNGHQSIFTIKPCVAAWLV